MCSDKEYVYVMDRYSLPVKDADGRILNPLDGHAQQLLAPSDPYYFNTLQDPFQKGSEFSRGYPYTLRWGVLTGLSHGQPYINADVDAATLLAKGQDLPEPRHGRGASQTVPHGLLFSLSAGNFAIYRTAAGPLMYFPPAAMARSLGYDIGDKNLAILSGWVIKTVLDYVRIGTKNGGETHVARRAAARREVVQNLSDPSSPPTHLHHWSDPSPLPPQVVQDLEHDLAWASHADASLDKVRPSPSIDRSRARLSPQSTSRAPLDSPVCVAEPTGPHTSPSHPSLSSRLALSAPLLRPRTQVSRWFASVTLKSNTKDSSHGTLSELLGLVDRELGAWHPFFKKYAEAYRHFASVYSLQHAFMPPRPLLPVASRASMAPLPDSEHRCAVFTIMHDEARMLSVWTRCVFTPI